MKKIVRICLISTFLTLCFAILLCFSFAAVSLVKFSALPLNADALQSTTAQVQLFDRENRQIKENISASGVSLSQLSPLTKQAFLSIEDKNFYSHHGLNYKRMAGAMLENIKSGSLKEGASTISQQLIKNTHLSSEKTFERKLKEIALTRKLEKNYSKDEILECYLNVIFFGNNCYGLESASEFYFSKEASDLSTCEACTLAGLIKSPSKFSPISNKQACLERRNLVLQQLQADGFLSEEELLHQQSQPIELSITRKSSSANSYAQAATDEAAKLLHITPKQLATGGFHVHTYQNQQKQRQLLDALSSCDVSGADKAAIAIDAQNYAVTAYLGDSSYKILSARRQPASCLKPLLVYAPALNEGLISPDTQILDEKITIGDYSPSNVNKKYGGHMSVTDAVKNSVNIPAIKCLSYVGIDTAKAYAQRLGIEFDEADNSYALALGGMTYGVNLQQLAGAYSVFANGGYFQSPSFVQYITDADGKLVYARKTDPQMVLREDSAYLMTNILEQTAKDGTARKLSGVSSAIGAEVAAKTGTVGGSGGNTDAYTIAYTPEEVVGVWFGSLDNIPLEVVGGNQPAQVAREFLLAQKYQKTAFTRPSSVVEAEVDALELEENHRLVLANSDCPQRYRKTCLFSRFNMPQAVSENFSKPPEINAEAQVLDGQIVLTLAAQKHVNYQIFKNEIPCQKISEKSESITLRLNFAEEECTLKIIATQNDSALTSTKTITLKNQTPQPQPKKWYI